MNKSSCALQLSVKNLVETYPKQCYFWTFTWKEVLPDWWYARSWAGFIKALCDFQERATGKWLFGVKVVEVSPGGHGLHYHAVLNQRISIQMVQRIGARYGIGRVHVRKCDNDAAVYMAKYMSKKGLPLSKGMHRWGTVNGFEGVKKNNVVMKSDFTFNMGKLFKGNRVSYSLTCAVYRASKVHGKVTRRNWSAFQKLGVPDNELFPRSGKKFSKCYVLKPENHCTPFSYLRKHFPCQPPARWPDKVKEIS